MLTRASSGSGGGGSSALTEYVELQYPRNIYVPTIDKTSMIIDNTNGNGQINVYTSTTPYTVSSSTNLKDDCTYSSPETLIINAGASQTIDVTAYTAIRLMSGTSGKIAQFNLYVE